jgi:hypothetical protein
MDSITISRHSLPPQSFLFPLTRPQEEGQLSRPNATIIKCKIASQQFTDPPNRRPRNTISAPLRIQTLQNLQLILRAMRSTIDSAINSRSYCIPPSIFPLPRLTKLSGLAINRRLLQASASPMESNPSGKHPTVSQLIGHNSYTVTTYIHT